MKQEMDYGSGSAQERAREGGYGYAFGSRIRALADAGERAYQSDADSVFGRLPGLRTRVGRQYGRSNNFPVPRDSESWAAQAMSILRRHPLRGVGAATAVGVIAGFLVWTLINRRR